MDLFQKNFKIKIIIFLVVCISCIQPSYSQENTVQLSLADSLFKKNELIESEKIYLAILASKNSLEENILYKLAYIAKRKNNYLDELKYLNSLNLRNSTPEISQRLEEIGKKRGLPEYEIDFLERLKWIYFQYFYLILFTLFIPLIYSIFVLFNKAKKREKIQNSSIVLALGYTLFLTFIFNLPHLFQFGIITPDKSYLRDFDSSGAPVLLNLKRGSKVLIIQENKVWNLCLKDQKLGYVLKNHLEKI